MHYKDLAPSVNSDTNGVLKIPTVTVHLRDYKTFLYTIFKGLHINRKVTKYYDKIDSRSIYILACTPFSISVVKCGKVF